jgi:hypothetical protein
MTFQILSRRNKYGRTRSEQEENLRKDGMGSLTDSQLDRVKFMERKIKEETGCRDNFLDQVNIDTSKI